ncbi:substrate-binding domain-containing protein [Polynucleobacter necessarius]|uniref:substrate-binding domain-containing protein n=1 Tax=Polynucleobacter necessarius TaxID=576610 RepID=UPI001E53DE49
MESQNRNSSNLNQSHGGSSKQAGAIIGGLEADVVTMNQSPDIDILVGRGNLVNPNWRNAFPKQSAPYSSVTVFLVRKGNPKNIKDWSGLTKPAHKSLFRILKLLEMVAIPI